MRRVLSIMSIAALFLEAAHAQQSTRRPRLNRLIEVLDQGKTAFGSFVANDSFGAAEAGARTDLDFVIFEMEHQNFDMLALKDSLQFLINRKRLAESDSPAVVPTPLVRIPSNAAEQNQWIIKQALDLGVFGLVIPHMGSVEEAEAAVQFSRYAQKKGVPDYEPAGHRGVSPGGAQAFWGTRSYPEYHELADVWPLDRNGELIILALIEDERGVANVREIASRVKGIGGLFVGEVDLSTSMGFPGNPEAPDVRAAIDRVLAIGKELNVPVGSLANRGNIEDRVRRGFRFLVTGDAEAITVGRKAAGRN